VDMNSLLKDKDVKPPTNIPNTFDKETGDKMFQEIFSSVSGSKEFTFKTEEFEEEEESFREIKATELDPDEMKILEQYEKEHE